jgi:hypothetical protein
MNCVFSKKQCTFCEIWSFHSSECEDGCVSHVILCRNLPIFWRNLMHFSSGLLLQTWKQQVHPKHWQLSTSLHTTKNIFQYILWFRLPTCAIPLPISINVVINLATSNLALNNPYYWKTVWRYCDTKFIYFSTSEAKTYYDSVCWKGLYDNHTEVRVVLYMYLLKCTESFIHVCRT